MPQDVADHLEIRAGVDLPACVTVAEGVTADRRGKDTGSAGIEAIR